MHPRLIACLVPTVAAAAAGAVWTLMAGWGWLAALAVYSVGGALALLGFAALAVAIEAREEEAGAKGRRTRIATGSLAVPARAGGRPLA